MEKCVCPEENKYLYWVVGFSPVPFKLTSDFRPLRFSISCPTPFITKISFNNLLIDIYVLQIKYKKKKILLFLLDSIKLILV